MQSIRLNKVGGTVLVAASVLALAACSKEPTEAPAPAATETVAAAAPSAAPVATVAADNTDTLTGVVLASYTGDAAKGETDFVTCKSCHAIEEGVNKIGPSLHGVVGRHAGIVEGFTYSDANENSGIVWTPEKLFQYLESPQRVVPGTKMTFTGFPDPQTRADVIAYLKTNS